MFRLRRSQGLLSFALAWFWLTLVPVLDIPKLGDNVFTERYLYIPTFGFCVLAAWGWLWLLKRASQPLTRRLAYAGVAGLVVFYSFVVVRRLPVWRSSATLWEQTARQDPDDPVAVNAAGTALYRGGQYPQALELFQRAVALAPGESYTHNGLGGAYFTQRRYDDALREFQKAVALSPDTGNYWRNLGVAYANKSMWPEAVDAFRHAIDRFGASAPPILTADARSTLTSLYVQYGTALLREGQASPAVDAFQNAVRVDPANFDARIRLGETLLQQGQLDGAASQIVQGLNADPGSPQAYLAHYYLSRIYGQKGMQEAANQESQKALELNPTIVGTPLGTSSLQLVAPGKEKKR
jgi:Flp pilus assembly protein TadD